MSRNVTKRGGEWVNGEESEIIRRGIKERGENGSLPRKVRHLKHDHAHVLGEHDDIVPGVVPLGDLVVEGHLLPPEQLHLLQDLALVLLGHFPHRLLYSTTVDDRI